MLLAWAEKQALSDTEERYRRRYVDLLSNPSTRETFKKRSKLVKFIQNRMDPARQVATKDKTINGPGLQPGGAGV